MFYGTIPDKARWVLTKYIPLLGEKVSSVGSGNFTLESAIRRNGYKGIIHSCDVSLYSCSIGSYLSHQDFRCEVKNSDFDWLSEYLTKDAGIPASIMLLFQADRFYKQKNDFQKRMWTSFLNQWDEMFEKTVDKIKKFRSAVRVDRFFPMDLHEYLKKDDLGTICTFFPTYPGGYERMYKMLDEVFDWDAPDFKEFKYSGKFLEEYFMDNHDSNWMILSEHDLGLHIKKEFQTAVIQKNRSITIYLYTNLQAKRYYVMRQIDTEPFSYDPIGDHIITADSKIEFIELPQKRMNYIRDIYTGQNVKLITVARINLLIVVDGKIAGGICIDDGKYGNTDGIYLLADFALPSIHKRLSKLILLIVQSTEMKEYIQKKLIKSVEQITTTAFTEKPVSMKYRGIFDLAKRGEGYLNYASGMGFHTIQEALNLWLRKHGQAKLPN